MKRGIGAAVQCALLCAVVLAASAGPALGDAPPPVNFIGTNFGPITTTISSNYDWATGTLAPSTATASVFSTSGLVENVYLGTPPAFHDCPTPGMWFSTGQLASDAAGLRWDTSQLCPGTFYNTYSGAVLCADTLGLRVSAILVSTDGGWNTRNQEFLFQQVQTNNVTRFP
jgi:hypothetical protein